MQRNQERLHDDFDCTESCNEIKNDCSQIDPEGSLCSDGVPCTDDVCNGAAGCSNLPTAAEVACDDGIGCTESDECDGSGGC